MDSPADGTTSLEPQLRALEADLMDLEAQTSRLSSLTPLREQQLAELQKEVSTVQIDRARLRNDLDSLRHAMGKYRALVGASDKLEERRLAMQQLCLTALAQAAQSSDSRTKGFSDEEIASLRRYWDSFEAARGWVFLPIAFTRKGALDEACEVLDALQPNLSKKVRAAATILRRQHQQYQRQQKQQGIRRIFGCRLRETPLPYQTLLPAFRMMESLLAS